ncbi:MAG: DUF4258 domain-containing protein [Patescibacteria group bacterium]
MGNIIFSLHAELKIKQRRISKYDVIQTVTDPDFEKSGHSFRVERYRKFGENYLKVVIKREAISIIVITTHWVAKLKNK